MGVCLVVGCTLQRSNVGYLSYISLIFRSPIAVTVVYRNLRQFKRLRLVQLQVQHRQEIIMSILKA